MTAAWNLLAFAPIAREVLDGLVRDLPVRLLVPEDRDGGVADCPDALLAEADLVLGDWRVAKAGFTAKDVARAPRLAFLQQPSVGVQGHDADALAAAGVPLSNVAGFNAVAVAEWALAAALSCCRLSGWAETSMRAGGWPQTEVIDLGSHELGGHRVGLLGFGAIGRECATRFAALGCPVSYWSRRRRPPEESAGAAYKELDELVADSEVLVVALPLTAQTRGLLGPERLAAMPAGSVLVVASRGGIVDEAAVAAAVGAGRLHAAAFDVYETEPLPPDSPLYGEPRIQLTPHVAGSSRESSLRLVIGVRQNVARAVSGEPVADVVNGVDPVVRRR